LRKNQNPSSSSQISTQVFGPFLSNMLISQKPGPKQGQTDLGGFFLLPGDILLMTLRVRSSLRSLVRMIVPIKNHLVVIKIQATTPL
jgi:hypothetical protein